MGAIFLSYNCYYEKTGSEVKNITEELPFEIPDSWCWVRFPSIVHFSLGKTPDRHTDKYWNDGAYPWFSIADMQDKKTITTSKEKISENALKEKFNGSLSPKGTLLMSFKLTVGRTSILGVEAVHNEAIISIFPFIDQKHITRDYLMNTLGLLVEYVEQTDAIKGATLNSNKLQHMFVPIPPIAEQERIVAEIEKIEPLIAEYDKLEQQATKLDSEIYDKLKKSILQYAIQGKLVPQNSNDEPAAVLLERIRAEKKAQLGKKYVESYIYKGDDNCYYEHINGKNIDITEEIPYDLPNGWEWTKLKNIVFNIADIDHKMPSTVENGIPYISPLNFIKGNKIDFVNAKKISVNDYIDLSKKCKPIKGDIIFPRYGTIGIIRTVDVDIDFLVSYSCATIKPNQTWAITEILYNFLNSPWIQVNQINKYINKTTQPNIGLNSIKEFLIPIPPLAEQKRIVEKIDEIFAKL